MKNLNLILLAFLVGFVSCSEPSEDLSPDFDKETINTRSDLDFSNLEIGKIGEIVNGKGVITVNFDDLKKKFSAHVSKVSDLNLSFDSVEIRKDEYDNYYLFGIDASKNSKSIVQLNVGDVNLRTDGGNKTVTCSGCTSTGPSSAGECEPTNHMNTGKYYCTSCSSGNCTKSTSI